MSTSLPHQAHNAIALMVTRAGPRKDRLVCTRCKTGMFYKTAEGRWFCVECDLPFPVGELSQAEQPHRTSNESTNTHATTE